jgi:hypothetical protein
LASAKAFRAFVGIFAELAVDLPRRKPGTVEQNLHLDDGGIDPVVSRPLGGILGVVDGRSVQAGGSGGQQQRARQHRGDEQADQSGNLQQGFG